MYVEIALPLKLEHVYTYQVPEALKTTIKTGSRVLVPLGKNKVYTGVIMSVCSNIPTFSTKEIIEILDEQPFLTDQQMTIVQWISQYYMCTQGEVLNAMLPKMFKSTATIEEGNIQWINKKYEPKKEEWIALVDANEEAYAQWLDQLKNAPKQKKILETLLFLTSVERVHKITKKRLLQESGAAVASLKALNDKCILTSSWEESEELRLEGKPRERELYTLSNAQKNAFNQIKEKFKLRRTVLFQGVTSSGKTEVYFQLIQEKLEQGLQVLYLIPEIALTAQLISRISAVYGDEVAVYHSRYGDRERAEVWRNVKQKKNNLVVGARSAIFLPFQDLQLIIVDEEHDGSYKQQDPAPRYNGRDTAIYLASLFKAEVLLGSATPSMESLYNVSIGKYDKVELFERFEQVTLPEIHIIDMRNQVFGIDYSNQLKQEIKKVLQKRKQVILFQNRKGYAPYVQCKTCGHIAQCKNCDVSLTYYKYEDRLRCHHCGYEQYQIKKCQKCQSKEVYIKGLGTEKIQEELSILFPDARIGRLDATSTRNKNAHQKIIDQFSQGGYDILVGTQMVTKGLDFKKVELVGVLHADNLLAHPSFKSMERSYQTLLQVSGRAGRTEKGTVIIQTYDPNHRIYQLLDEAKYSLFSNQELQERKAFHYPPYYRLIKVYAGAKKREDIDQFAWKLLNELKNIPQLTLMGPVNSAIARKKNIYWKEITIKIRKDGIPISNKKNKIIKKITQLKTNNHRVLIKIDVDSE